MAAYGYAAELAFFYANTQTNDYTTVKRVDMSVASPAWPFTGPVPEGRYRLVATHSNKCLAISGGALDDGAKVVQSACNGDDAQAFDLVGAGSGFYKLLNRRSGKALDVNGASTADGAVVQQWTDNGSGAQRFSLKASINGGYALVNQGSGKCVDVPGSSANDGAGLIQWSCNGNANQSFKFMP